MPALPAADGLAALEGHVLVAVAALVVHRARVDVDLLLGFRGAAVVAAVLLCGHSGEWLRGSVRGRGGETGGVRWDVCVCVCLCFFVGGVGGVAPVEKTNCEDKAEWRRGSGARALSIAGGPEAAAGALSHGDYVRQR